MARIITALLYPGQGPSSVFPGMAKEVLVKSPGATKVFYEAGRVLDKDMLSLCLYAPKEELGLTENSQLAALVMSLANAAVLREKGERALGDPRTCLAGNSVGIWAAVLEAQAISFEHTFQCVQERARLMTEAARERPGKMMVGLHREDIDIAAVEAMCTDKVRITNYNSPNQFLLGGPADLVGEVARAIQQEGLVARFIPFLSEGAWHSFCMEPVEEPFVEFLKGIPIKDPNHAIIGNQGQLITTADALREELGHGPVRPVVWRRKYDAREDGVIPTLQSMGVTRYLEVGAGEVLIDMLPSSSHKRRKIAGIVAVGILAVGGATSGVVLVKRQRRRMQRRQEKDQES